jgi:hypothetical protein
MYNQQPTQLDPALQALITLKQRANPILPNGQPTVAGQMMGQAGIGAINPAQMGAPQAQAMPPQGQQQQGLPGIIANVQKANPSMQQNAQQGQVDQMAQQVSQRMQQQQQPPGVSGLPANNMGFAEGGIVPYFDGGGVDLSQVKYGQGFTPAAGIAGALPTEPESPEVAELRMREAERAALAKQRIPELYSRGTEAIDAARNEAEAAQQQVLKERGMERLMAVLSAGSRSRYGAGEGYLNFQNAARKSDALYAQQKQLNAMARLEQDKLRYSLETGSNTAAQEAVKNIAGIKDKLSDNAFQIKQLAETARGTDVRAAESQADREARGMESKADRESRERISAGSNATTLKAATIREELDQKRATRAASLALYRQQVAGLIKRRDAKMPFDSAGAEKINKQIKNLSEQSGFTPLELLGVEDAGAGAGGAGGASGNWGQMSVK